MILLDQKLHDFPVSDGVGEDVPLPQDAVIVRAGLTLSKPGHDTGMAESETSNEESEMSENIVTCAHSWSGEDPSDTTDRQDTHTGCLQD